MLSINQFTHVQSLPLHKALGYVIIIHSQIISYIVNIPFLNIFWYLE
jgi:hypothetical protein